MIVGGYSSGGGGPLLDETLVWNGTWKQLTPGPSARDYASLAHDPARGVMVLFGGQDRFSGPSPIMFDDTWILDGETWQRVTPGTAPSMRAKPALVGDAKRGNVVLFGGEYDDGNGFAFYGDTWLWNGTTWTQASPATSPPPRGRAGVGYDPIRERVVLFGGATDGSVLNDETWEWDGTTWTQIATPNRPSPRTPPALAWDAARQRIVLFGGDSNLSDVWEYDGRDWTRVYPNGTIGARHTHVVVPDLDGAGILTMFGSGNAFPLAGIHRLRWDGGLAETCIGDDTDGDGLASCSDPDCWAVCTPTCPPGITCLATDPRCGDGVCNAATESCRTCPMDCTCAVVCGDNVCTGGETQSSCAGDCAP